MHFITDTINDFKALNKRRWMQSLINLCLIVSTALMTWKTLMLATYSEAPIVVVLSGSMEPAYYRGDILFLELHEEVKPLRPGDSIVYKLGDHLIPIIHRIVNIHYDESNDFLILTKGDNNRVNDRALYTEGQLWLKREDLMGRVMFYLPYVGIVTIWINDYPILKYLLIGSMVVLVITSREPQS